MKILISVLFATLTLASGLVRADDHQHRTFFKGCAMCARGAMVAEVVVDPEQSELTATQIRDLAAQGHHAIEAEDETHGRARQFIEKFNFKKVALAKTRWYGMNKHLPHLKNAAANVSLLFVASHGTEMATGTGMIIYGALAPGLSPTERWAWMGSGFTIMIPGTDPLCYLAQGCYLLFPKTLNWLLTIPREASQKLAAKVNEKLGNPPGYWSDKLMRFRKSRMIDRLDKAYVDMDSLSRDEYLMTFHAPDGRDVATLEIERLENGEMGLRRVELARSVSNEYLVELRHATSALGFNVGNWLGELVVANRDGKLDQIEKLPYVDHVELTDDALMVTTNPRAFAMPNACAELL